MCRAVLFVCVLFLSDKGERITLLYATQVFGAGISVALVWFQTPRRVDTLTEQVGALFFIVMFWRSMKK